ncbi:MAG: hypothetical protein ABH858_06500, partial [Candidatus Omnitrophota bacterium]
KRREIISFIKEADTKRLVKAIGELKKAWLLYTGERTETEWLRILRKTLNTTMGTAENGHGDYELNLSERANDFTAIIKVEKILREEGFDMGLYVPVLKESLSRFITVIDTVILLLSYDKPLPLSAADNRGRLIDPDFIKVMGIMRRHFTGISAKLDISSDMLVCRSVDVEGEFAEVTFAVRGLPSSLSEAIVDIEDKNVHMLQTVEGIKSIMRHAERIREKTRAAAPKGFLIYPAGMNRKPAGARLERFVAGLTKEHDGKPGCVESIVFAELAALRQAACVSSSSAVKTKGSEQNGEQLAVLQSRVLYHYPYLSEVTDKILPIIESMAKERKIKSLSAFMSFWIKVINSYGAFPFDRDGLPKGIERSGTKQKRDATYEARNFAHYNRDNPVIVFLKRLHKAEIDREEKDEIISDFINIEQKAEALPKTVLIRIKIKKGDHPGILAKITEILKNSGTVIYVDSKSTKAVVDIMIELDPAARKMIMYDEIRRITVVRNRAFEEMVKTGSFYKITINFGMEHSKMWLYYIFRCMQMLDGRINNCDFINTGRFTTHVRGDGFTLNTNFMIPKEITQEKIVKDLSKLNGLQYLTVKSTSSSIPASMPERVSRIVNDIAGILVKLSDAEILTVIHRHVNETACRNGCKPVNLLAQAVQGELTKINYQRGGRTQRTQRVTIIVLLEEAVRIIRANTPSGAEQPLVPSERQPTGRTSSSPTPTTSVFPLSLMSQKQFGTENGTQGVVGVNGYSSLMFTNYVASSGLNKASPILGRRQETRD